MWRAPRGKEPRPPDVPNAPMSINKQRRAQFRAIHEFFAREYPDFNYNRRKPFPEEFLRLHRHQGWPMLTLVYKYPVRDAAWRAYHAAVYEAFSDTFGRNTRSKFKWSFLATQVGIEPVEDLERMRRVSLPGDRVIGAEADAWQEIVATNFNIVDLMAAMQRRDLKMEMPDPPEPCATEKELATYPMEKTVWFFPKWKDLHPNQGMLLALLKELEGSGKHRWAEKKPAWEDSLDRPQESSSNGPLDMLGTLTII
jgi:hypothetical protein